MKARHRGGVDARGAKGRANIMRDHLRGRAGCVGRGDAHLDAVGRLRDAADDSEVKDRNHGNLGIVHAGEDFANARVQSGIDGTENGISEDGENGV